MHKAYRIHALILKVNILYLKFASCWACFLALIWLVQRNHKRWVLMFYIFCKILWFTLVIELMFYNLVLYRVYICGISWSLQGLLVHYPYLKSASILFCFVLFCFHARTVKVIWFNIKEVIKDLIKYHFN